MKKLIRSSMLLGGTEMALVLISIIRSKYLATHIGPEGLGLYSILSSFFLLITTFCGGWFGQAYIKFVAEYHKDRKKENIQTIHNFSFTIVCLIVPVIILLLFIFKNNIKKIFLSNEILDFHYAIFASLFIVNSIKGIYGYYLNATLLIKETVKTKFLTTIFELISIVTLVYLFSITGFFISILLSGIISLIIFVLVTGKHIKTKFDLKTIGHSQSNKLVKFGSINIGLLFLNNISQYLYRFFVLNSLNIAFLGLFQATTSLTNYIGVINRGADFSYIPIMSQNLSPKDRNKNLNDYLRFNIVIVLAISSVAILFCKELISIFYSRKFEGLHNFFYVFVFAQFLNVLVISLQSIIIGTNNYKVHSIVVVGTNIIWIVIPYLLIKKLGLSAIGLGMIIASLWSIVFNYIYLRKNLNIKISKQVFLAILLAITFLSLAVFISVSNNIFIKVLMLFTESIFVLAILEKNEREKIYKNSFFMAIHKNALSTYTFIKWNI